MGKRVLFVDDAYTFAAVENSIFRRTGATMETAHSSREALEMLDEFKPDVIMLYVDMPDIPGDELCGRLKKDKRYSHIPIMLVARPAGSAEVEKIYASECDELVTLPFQEEMILERLAKLLGIPYRQSLRILVRLELKATSRKDVFFGTSEDISKSGMYIETEKELQLNDCIALRFYLIAHQEIVSDAIILRKEVKRNGFGYGVKFQDMPLATQNMITKFIQSRSHKHE